MIKDLNSSAQQLTNQGLDLAEAHRLLLRAIFANYLQTRGWLSEEFLRENFGVVQFNEALSDPGVAHHVFAWLAATFNGDVFPTRTNVKYTAEQLAELRFLLQGGDPKSRQRYLWPYEFDVIPVELLSSIYESFSHAIDRRAAEARSTHYTPINLVELTLNEVFDDELFGQPLPPDAKVADFACGSGVFLVQALRRLVSRRVAAGEKLTRKLIRDTLYNQIFGVDVLGGAVHVAAVSLYLAALELDPRPGIGNGVKFWPLIYPRDDEEAQRARPHFNLFEDDAFDPDAAFRRDATGL
ncbi:MAG: N-6 DNA methylase [Planctomycetota bacterium]|nr:N-6 DNA methylase [Planctomycetota bacterium]